MPIYAYKCSSCGHAQDVLQKMSAAALTDCPACGKSTYSKQVTAPQFQLKGSGWYVTDFKGGASGGKDSKPDSKTVPATADTKSETTADSGAASTAPSTPAASPSTSAPAKPAAASSE